MLSLGNLKVLIVEDSMIHRMLAVRFLKKLNVDVVEASNGQKAVELLTSHPNEFDVVFMVGFCFVYS